MERADAAVIVMTIVPVEWTVGPFVSLQGQHSQKQSPQQRHTMEREDDQSTQNATTTIECSMDDHTSLYCCICSDTLSMTTSAMDQSMRKRSITVQLVVRQRRNTSAVMMAGVVALVVMAAAPRKLVEGVGNGPNRGSDWFLLFG
jgi:hypothetical protein